MKTEKTQQPAPPQSYVNDRPSGTMPPHVKLYKDPDFRYNKLVREHLAKTVK